FLIERDHLGVARQFPYSLLYFFSGEGRRLPTHEFLEVLLKAGIFKGLGHRFTQDLHQLRRSAGRKMMRPTRYLEGAQQVDHLTLPLISREGVQIGKTGQPRVEPTYGVTDRDEKVNRVSYIFAKQAVNIARCPGIQLAGTHSDVHFRVGKTHDKFGVLEIEIVSEHPRSDVN